MDPIAAVSLAATVIQLVDFTTKVCLLVKEYSNLNGAPKEIRETAVLIEENLKTLIKLKFSGRTLSADETTAIDTCMTKAKALISYLEGFKSEALSPATDVSRHRWRDRSLRGLRKVRLSVKVTFEKQKLEDFQIALDRFMGLVRLHTQLRTEDKVVAVSHDTEHLIHSSEHIISTLDNVQNDFSKLVLSNEAPSFDKLKAQAIFSISATRNRDFVGRENVLLALEKALIQAPQTQEVKRVSLWGLGGVGKSHIAIEFAYRFRERIPGSAVIWIHAATAARFEQDFKSIAQDFHLPGRDSPQTDILKLVKDWLEIKYEKAWLLIIDNVDDEELFKKTSTGKSCREYLPVQSPQGAILYTSRNRKICFNLTKSIIDVLPMTALEAESLLGHRIGGMAAPDEQKVLLEELDYLPLAITQAASYMTETGITMAEYLAEYRESKESKMHLLSHEFSDLGRGERPLESVTATWKVSFEYIRLKNPRAAEILSLMSFFDRQSIPQSLLINDGENSVLFRNAVTILEQFSLIIHENRDNYSMHRLVQIATSAWVSRQGIEEEQKWAATALQNLSTKFPDAEDEFEHWTTCALYMPHVETILGLDVEDTETNSLALANLLIAVGEYLRQRGAFDNALLYVDQSLQTLEKKSSNVRSIRLSKAKRVKGEILSLQGDTTGSIVLLQQALEDFTNLLGYDHFETCRTMRKLAFSLDIANRSDEAESLSRQAVEYLKNQPNHKTELMECKISLASSMGTGKESDAEVEELFHEVLLYWKSQYGEYNPYVEMVYGMLGLWLMEKGRFKEAEKFLDKSLAISTSCYGLEHRETILSMDFLGRVKYKLGDVSEAEQILREGLLLSEKCLGKSHPITLDIADDLSEALRLKGKYVVAEDLLSEAILRVENLQPGSDTSWITLIRTLIGILRDQNKNRETERWHKILIDYLEKAYGRNSSESFSSLIDWADTLSHLKRYPQSEKLLFEVMNRSHKQLGKHHPKTLDSIYWYARVLYRHGLYQSAENWGRYVMRSSSKILGEHHKDTLYAMELVAEVLEKRAKYEKSEEVYRKLIAQKKVMLTEEGPDLVRITKYLGDVLLKQNKNEAAERCYKELLGGGDLTQEHGDPKTLSILTGLGRAFHLQNKNQEAEKLYRIAWPVTAKVFGGNHHRMLVSMNNLGVAFDRQGKYDEAEGIYKETLKGMEEVLGISDKETLNTRSNLVRLLTNRGKLDEAAKIEKRAVIAIRTEQSSTAQNSMFLEDQKSPSSATPSTTSSQTSDSTGAGLDTQLTSVP